MMRAALTKWRTTDPGRRTVLVIALGLGLALLAMVILLASVLGVQRESLDHIASQDRKITALFNEIEPLVEAGSPAVRDIGTLIDEATATAEEVRPVLRSAEPALDATLDVLIVVRRFFEQVDPDLTNTTLSAVSGVTRRLLAEDRLTRMIDQITALLVQIEAENLVGRAARAERRLGRLLAIQRRAFRVSKRSLAIQAQSLEHVRSLDQKTGGELNPSTP